MEDTEQRKKRLKEMRMQADLAEVSGGVPGSDMPGFLSNPLVDAPSTMPSQDKSHAAPRFDFYTDPMNAFSSNKRSNANIHTAPDRFPPPNFGGSPMSQFPRAESTNPHMTPSPNQASPAATRNTIWNGPRGPAQYNAPFHQSSGGVFPSPRFEPPKGPYQSSGGVYPSPRFEPPRGPYQSSGGAYARPRFEPPKGPYPSSGGAYPSPRFEPPRGPYPSSGGAYASPRFEPPGDPLYESVPGVDHQPSYSPNHSPRNWNGPSPSRGRGRGFGNNRGSQFSGRGSGQGSSHRGRWSNDDRASGPDRFYRRSMIEDPWKHLEPAIWEPMGASSNTSHTPHFSKPSTSKSISESRDVSIAASVKSNSEPSLAEYLASAFNEATNDAENV